MTYVYKVFFIMTELDRVKLEGLLNGGWEITHIASGDGYIVFILKHCDCE